ncbi:preprotein translocase subunit SecG [Suicoccus acidiformans]|uniref:Protein-export membrane protein SecG n=1 Tax=Suicoccus acidiformans TaxID=2036206 RepID=A0A347WJB6_9LACT|nr:preprotein translocase subunit SecG [Suicoccus acidiformans]AXY25173.1 preprotein translocase subunit SecG [Suicoccus acidiformans]
MYTALQTALLIVSVLIIILVIMQPSKSNAASMLSGDDGQPKTKARGFESFLIRATTVLAVLFFVLAIAMAMIAK